LAIQERAAAEEEPGFEQRNGFKVARTGRKRVKTSAIPDVHTFHANEARNADCGYRAFADTLVTGFGDT
jgi:hypothetical protein